MATYVNDLRLKEIATGDESGTWGASTNTNLELIAEAFSFGTEAITTNADTHTTTIADGSTDPGRSIYLKYTGTLDSACTITIGPNTVSKLWFIENGTSGSQNIIISQGSGANVTIPAGHVKAVYSDGAGSGAAMVDAFTNLNLGGTTTVDDLTISDDLTVTDDMTIGGTLGVTGIVTLTDDLIIGDGKTIGSASDVDAMTIASNGQVTFSQTLIGTALDISGDIDVDGTSNLDVVDIDGAVDMASTLAVGGVVTANAGVVVDNITIDGTEIDLSSGDLTIDVAGDIILDADGGDFTFKDGGTTQFQLQNSSGDVQLVNNTQDKDIKFMGDDGGSTITALTLDMSDAGTAIFNNKVGIGTTSPGKLLHLKGSAAQIRIEDSDGTNQIADITSDSGDMFLTSRNNTSHGEIIFRRFNGTSVLETARFDDSGNFGIGTSSPSEPLHVNEGTGGVSTTLLLQNSSASVDGRGTNLTFKSSSTEIGQIQSKTSSDATSGILAFKTASSGTLSEQMRIDKDGNVGIGTTSPATLLSLQGDAELLRLDGTANTTRTIFFRNTTAANPAQIHSDGSLKLRAEDSGTHMEFHTVDTERMRIDSSGRLLVASSTAVTGNTTAKLQINGTDNAGSTISIGRFSNNTNAPVLNFIKSRNGTVGGNTIVQDDDNLGSILFGGNDGTDNVSIAAKIFGEVDGTPGSNDMPGRLTFFTTADGASTPTERMRIDASGNVGIGESSTITGKIHVKGSPPATNGGIVFVRNSDAASDNTTFGGIHFSSSPGTDFSIGKANVNSATSLSFRNGNTGASLMELDSSGNLGLGTSSPSFNTGSGLEIERSGTATIRLQDSGNKSVELLQSSDFEIHCLNSGANVVINPTSKTIFETGSTERMRIDASGNVGIGTTSPSQLLNLQGQSPFIQFNQTGTDSFAGINFGDDDDANDGQILYDHDERYMRFQVANAERVRIDASGNFLVGKSSANLATAGIELLASDFANFTRDGGLSAQFNRLSSDGAVIGFLKAGSTVGTISVTSSATAYNTSSDARLKDITGSSRGLDVINELNPVAYNWKEDGKADEGLIAQEVKELVPNAVSQTEDDYYQMDYSKLVTHLVKGMQEQQEQIESLKSEIAILKGE
tara:strand:- start:18394 stop:21768 length:3375 start_codon:yes stop_codon:yes gene_type:complete